MEDESYLPASPPARLTAYEFHVVSSREKLPLGPADSSHLHLVAVGCAPHAKPSFHTSGGRAQQR
jgi:hypothetical protein